MRRGGRRPGWYVQTQKKILDRTTPSAPAGAATPPHPRRGVSACDVLLDRMSQVCYFSFWVPLSYFHNLSCSLPARRDPYTFAVHRNPAGRTIRTDRVVV